MNESEILNKSIIDVAVKQVITKYFTDLFSVTSVLFCILSSLLLYPNTHLSFSCLTISW
jgi:hypothetical protein